MNGFVLLLRPLLEIPQDEFGASAFQKDMMKISKMDEFKLKIKRVRDFNPLNRVNVNIE